jgi:MerR family transcriptional regulator, light-induced transcriptional regulator
MHYPIRTIATMTGVKPVTLRAWETRYGLLDPIRTESGHRLYSDRDIETIQRALALRARGIPIRQVPELLLKESAEPEADKNWQSSRDDMLAAISQFEEPELDRIYQKVMGLYPVTAVIENLIEPVLVSLGKRWETTRGGIAEEHFFSVYISHKLEARFQQQFGRATGPLIVLACLPHENHDLGMSLFCLAAHEANYRVSKHAASAG